MSTVVERNFCGGDLVALVISHRQSQAEALAKTGIGYGDSRQNLQI